VWVGNASGAAMHDVSGTSGAAPIWAEVMGWLHRATPSRAPRPPQGLVHAAVRFGHSGGQDGWLESAREEWFLAGTQQPLFAIDAVAASAGRTSAGGKNGSNSALAGDAGAAARILSPAPGTILALDPDIPPERQRLQFAATSGQPGALRWRMDGKVVAQGARWAWLPWPGRHRVELIDARGQVLDTVQIEVRGAGVRTGQR